LFSSGWRLLISNISPIMKIKMCTATLAAVASLFLCSSPVEAAVTNFRHVDTGIADPKPKKKPAWHLAKNPFAPAAHHASSSLTCGHTAVVGANTDKYEDCPATCPYFAQNRKDSDHCTFLCVTGKECGTWNPNKPIPDTIKSSKTCRGPKVSFCNQPKLDGTDTCDVCASGYDLHDGHCYFKYWTPFIIVSAILAVLLVVVTVWVVDLCCREAINDEEVERCNGWRSRSKILQKKQDGAKRGLYPIETNLCNKAVAGPGMLLHFNFQAFFIFWPLCVALVWVALACFHNELFILGTRKFGTPRHNCILVAWGYETQQRLMWTKVLFLAIVYVGSFVSFLLFSVRQLRLYQQFDAEERTMKDFAVELKGLPEMPGTSADVEKDIKAAVEKALHPIEIVNISVAWQFQDHQEIVDYACMKDLTDCEEEEAEIMAKTRGQTFTSLIRDFEDPTTNMGAVHKWMYNKEKALLGPDDPDLGEDPKATVTAVLEKLVTSDTAFVVFNTSRDTEAALSKTVEFDATKYGFGVRTLTMEAVENEPANLNWHNFCDNNPILGFLKGFFKVYLPALLIWFFAFYVPYAYSLYYFNYDNGAELPGYYSAIFTIIVCGGNATMYVVCDVCCDMIGFRYKDTKQVTYMLMYLCACMINVVLDMVVTYYTAMKVMVGLDFRTYHGVRLAEIDTFTEQFETYAMQRSLGENTYRYAWPSTFFLCFVLEPFVTILVPYLLGRAIVRTHKEIRGTCAEAYIAAFEFDLGRYADILLNVFLGTLIFYFPGGYIWTLFFFMAFSHAFIYSFDHWRVLSVIPTVKIVSSAVDWWAQVMMCFCCAMILSCLVFKANCESYSGYCVQSWSLIGATSLAGVLHFIVHLLLLIYLVPKLGKEVKATDKVAAMTFAAVAEHEPRTWFSVNPVHCLRSKYIHEDYPHCRLASWGKEHCLEKNAEIGCFFDDEKAEEEDFHQDMRKSLSGLSASFSAVGSSLAGSPKKADESPKKADA